MKGQSISNHFAATQASDFENFDYPLLIGFVCK